MFNNCFNDKKNALAVKTAAHLLCFVIAVLVLIAGFGVQRAHAAEHDPVTLDANWINYETNDDGGLTIVDFNYGTNSPTEIKIPKEIEGKLITKIKEDAFSGCALTYVEFDEDSAIQEIGANAFSGNAIVDLEANGKDDQGKPETLSDLPNSVKRIGKKAFFNNKELKSLNLSGLTDLTEILEATFSSCTKMSGELKLPESLTKIGGEAFSYVRITKVVFPANLKTVANNAFYSVPGNVEFDLSAHEPNSVANAPWRANNSNVIWKNTHDQDANYDSPFLFDIEEKMIYGIKPNIRDEQNTYTGWDWNTKTITVPAEINGVKVEKMASATFSGDETIDLISEVKFAEGCSLTAIPNFGFYRCRANTYDVFPASITSIGDYAFNHSWSKGKLDFPGVTKVGNNAFYFGGEFVEVIFGGSVSSIGKDCFRGSNKLRTIRMPNTSKASLSGWPWQASRATFYWKDGETTKPELNIENDVTGDWQVIPDRNMIFGYVGDETEITIPSELEVEGIEGKVLIYTVGDGGTVNILQDNTQIADKKIKSITVSDGIKIIEGHALESLGLEVINLGGTLEEIKVNGLKNNKLTEIKFPSTMKSLGGASLGDNKITGTVTIPGNVTSISADAFAGNAGINSYEMMMYLNTDSDEGAYDEEKELYKRAPSGVRGNAPWGVPAAAKHITYRDKTKATGRSQVEVTEENAKYNTVTIKFTARTNNNFFVVKKLEPENGMPILNNTYCPQTQGMRYPAKADMIVSSQTKDGAQGGDGTYTINMTYGSQIDGSDIEDITISYSAEVNGYFHKLNYDANNGNKNMTGRAPEAKDVYVVGHKPVLADNENNMAIEGYSFTGWNTKKDGTGDSHAAGEATFAMPKSDATLYAVWTPNKSSITFNGNGGLFAEERKTKTVDGVTDQDFTNMGGHEIPVREGYEFMGWATDSYDTAANIWFAPAGGATVYAVWKAGEGITAVAGANGGRFNDGKESKDFTEGTVDSALGSMTGYEEPTREGYEFLGWADTNTAKEPNVLKVPTASQTIYAVWGIKSYDVTFNANGGNFNGEESKTIRGEYNAKFTSIEGYEEPVRAGYDFIGWVAETGESGDKEEKENVPANDLTVYALWSEKNVEVTFDGNGGVFYIGDDEKNEYKATGLFETDLRALFDYEEPEREDYDFAGWSTNKDSEEPDIEKIPAENMTIYAVWKESKATAAEIDEALKLVNTAQTDMEAIYVSEDGADVMPADQWVTQTEKEEMATAIEAVKSAIETEGITKIKLKNALIIFAAAKEKFDAQKKQGIKQDNPEDIPDEVTPEDPVPTVTITNEIASTTNDNDIKGSTYAPIKLLSKKQSTKTIKLQWSKVKGAKRYTIYGSECGKGKKYKKLATVSGSKKAYTVKNIAKKKLKKGKYYKFMIIAEKGDKTIAISKTMHVTTKGHKKNDNHKKVTVSSSIKKKAQKLKVGKSVSLKAKAVAPAGRRVSKHVAVRYESSNKKVAKVSKSGKIKAIDKGNCYIYAYAQNGVSVRIKVKVK